MNKIFEYINKIINNNKLLNYNFIVPNHLVKNSLYKIITKKYNKLFNSYIILPNIVTLDKFVENITNIRQVNYYDLLYDLYNVIFDDINLSNIKFNNFINLGLSIIKIFDYIDCNLININNIDYNVYKFIFSNNNINLNKIFNSISNLHNIYNIFYKKLKYNKYSYIGLIYNEAIKIINNKKYDNIIFINIFNVNPVKCKIIECLLLNKNNFFFIDKLRNNNFGLSIFYNNFFNFLIRRNNINVYIMYNVKKVNYINIINTYNYNDSFNFIINLIKKKKKIIIYIHDNELAIRLYNLIINSKKKVFLLIKKKIKYISIYDLFTNIYNFFLNRNNKSKFIFFNELEYIVNSNILNAIFTKTDRNIIKLLINDKYICINKIYNLLCKKDILFLITIDKSNIYNIILFSCRLCKLLINKLFKNIRNNIYINFIITFSNFLNYIIYIIKNNKYIHFLCDIKEFIILYKEWGENYISLNSNNNKYEYDIFITDINNYSIDKYDETILLDYNDKILSNKNYIYSYLFSNINNLYLNKFLEGRNNNKLSILYYIIQNTSSLYYFTNNVLDDYDNFRIFELFKIDTFNIIKNIYIINKKENKDFVNCNTLTIYKNKYILDNILNIVFKKGVSFSMISLYLHNAYLFYNKYILKINCFKTNKYLEYRMIIGKIIHKSLYKLYINIVGRIVDLSDIYDIKCMTKNVIDNYLYKYTLNLKQNDLNINIINYIVYKYINEFILLDEKIVKNSKKLIIYGLEKKIYNNILINNLYDKRIKYMGYVDRIDIVDNIYRIIDYKLKIIDLNIFKIDKKIINLLFSDIKYVNILQVIFYSIIFTYNKKNIKLSSSIFGYYRGNYNLIKININNSFIYDFNDINCFTNKFNNVVNDIINIDNNITFNI